jgi:hypothetical protein
MITENTTCSGMPAPKLVECREIKGLFSQIFFYDNLSVIAETHSGEKYDMGLIESYWPKSGTVETDKGVKINLIGEVKLEGAILSEICKTHKKKRLK